MSTNWASDIAEMHNHYGVHDWFEENKDDKVLMNKYLMFRLLMCQEELHETMQAMNAGNAEEVVDGLIDLIVFAIGTLDVFKVNPHIAWDEVHSANMKKETGVKPGRPNPFGLPDLLKPGGWQPPNHAACYNHGEFEAAFQKIRDRTPIDRSAW